MSIDTMNAEKDKEDEIVAWIEHVRDTETDGMAWKALNMVIEGIRAGAPEVMRMAKERG